MLDAEGPLSEFLVVLADALINIAYVAGVYFVEEFLRPQFGAEGIPLSANLVLFLSDATLIIGLASRMWRAFDQLVVQVSGWSVAKIVTSFYLKIRLMIQGTHHRSTSDETGITNSQPHAHTNTDLSSHGLATLDRPCDPFLPEYLRDEDEFKKGETEGMSNE
ncbi:hypothetical protein [Aggregatilinea lenta]|uniref:hypothetical protein n=1 Tax=Aggregatilinea lenta TaxID=913108 RepID=UPI0013C324BC|nr:hypothetical protein [Aggregatilinea lenta]